MKYEWTTTSPEETRTLAQEVLKKISGQAVLLLHGDLGAGKTCFVQGLTEAMGLEVHVTSPTYGLLKEYGEPPQLIHADLYRLQEEEELEEIGLLDWLDASVLMAIEWPNRAPNAWPSDAWNLHMSPDPEKETVRRIRLSRGEGA